MSRSLCNIIILPCRVQASNADQGFVDGNYMMPFCECRGLVEPALPTACFRRLHLVTHLVQPSYSFHVIRLGVRAIEKKKRAKVLCAK